MPARPIQLADLLPKPPPSLPVWARVLYYLAETVAIGVQYKEYEQGLPIYPTQTTVDDAPADTWRRFKFTVDNLDSTLPADDQAFDLDVVNYTNGAVDNSWTAADYTTVMAAMEQFALGLVGTMVPWLRISRCDAYVMAFNPYSNPKPFTASGAPEHTLAMNHPGTGGSQMFPQMCTTITEMTALRKHWGRMYLPTLSASGASTAGRLTTAFVDALAAGYNDLATSLAAGGFYPVVPTTMAGGSKGVPSTPTRALQGVNACKVDDVADVHRSRRWREPTYSKTLGVPTAPGSLETQTLPAA